VRVARVISVLNRRRDWIVERLGNLVKCHGQARPWLEEEKRAIENAIPILEAELNKRQLAVMEQRETHRDEQGVAG
jgi:hypothetical protein